MGKAPDCDAAGVALTSADFSLTANWPQPAAMSMPRRCRTVLGSLNSSARIFWKRRAASLRVGAPS